MPTGGWLWSQAITTFGSRDCTSFVALEALTPTSLARPGNYPKLKVDTEDAERKKL